MDLNTPVWEEYSDSEVSCNESDCDHCKDNRYVLDDKLEQVLLPPKKRDIREFVNSGDYTPIPIDMEALRA